MRYVIILDLRRANDLGRVFLMVNFILCDDNDKIVSSVAKIIDQEMMKNQITYKKNVFNDYNKDFLKLAKSRIANKIYILDIETPTSSGIDIARMIREKDMESVIIFLTSHDEIGYTVLKNEFLFLSFINKYDNYKNNLKRVINKALEIINKRKIIKFEDKGANYMIPLNDILYVVRDSIERKIIIVTDYSRYKINKSLIEMLEILGDTFKKSHRSCLVNVNRVTVVNSTKRKIIFDTGEVIDWVSPKYKNEVIKT